MAECKECFHYEVCCKLIGKEKIDRVSWVCHFPDQCFEFKSTIPQTNGDRIRAMSDEELAELFHKIADGNESCTLICGNLDKCKRNNATIPICKKHYFAWLKQPVKEED